MGGKPAESSVNIRQRVSAARQLQSERFAKMPIYCNAQMSSRHIKKYCELDNISASLLERAVEKLGLSARAYNRILKISRTIADLESQKDIQAHHVSEAIQYRTIGLK
ncbi:MAG: ATP-binding protein [Bacteroidales bacterium]|nr:ATP-binding protein [Bacteroidales bacterium]